MSKSGADKGKVIAGLFIGMVLGITAAGGVAWYVLKKNPAEFANREPLKHVAAAAQPPAIAPVAAAVAPSTEEAKQHFEFYKVLTDKTDGAARATVEKAAPKPKETTVAKLPSEAAAAPKDMYYVQAGSFQNVGDAEKLKAKLAFSGFEANIQAADIPQKGTWHRVRLGPYGSNDAVRTVAALRQSGIIATQVRAQ